MAKFWLKGVVVATVGGLLLLALTPNVESATAASDTIVLPSPYLHGLSYNVESTYSADPLVVPRSARSIRLLLADATLILDTATYRVFGQDFESHGTATLDRTSHSVVIALPEDFFEVRSGHSPIRSDSPVAEYYGIELQASGPATGPVPSKDYDLGFYVGEGQGRSSTSANLTFQAAPASSATSATVDLTLAAGEVWQPGDDRSYSHGEFTWVPHVQEVSAGDTITLIGPPGHWNTNLRGERVNSSAWVWYANEVAYHNQLSLPSVVSQGGSRLTITIPEAIERYNYSAPPRIEIQTNSGPEGENTVMTYVPIHIRYHLTPPEVPDVDWVSPGNGEVTLAWALPEAGGKVDTYRIHTFSGDKVVKTQEVTGLFDQVTVPGLINGKPYSFDVTAMNSAASSAPSARTAIFTPRAEFFPPTILHTVPVNNARSISQTAGITAVFSEPVTKVSPATVVLRSGTTPVTSLVSYDSSTRTVTLKPTAALTADRLYTASLSGIRDVAGNLMAPASWSFKTGPAPTIVSTTPANKAHSIGQTANMSMIFSEPATKVSGTSVSLYLGDSIIPATVIYNGATQTAVLDPVSTLPADRVYTMRVDGVLDAVGNPLVATTWTFSTGPAPTIVKATPANGSTKVRRNGTAIITMSETITGYGPTTVRLTKASTGSLIPAAVSFNSTSKALSLKPSSPLSANTKYIVKITGGSTAVRDLAGNPLRTKSWSFTTGSSL